MTGEHERRNAPRDQVAIKPFQWRVARRASGESLRARIEGESVQHFTQLLAKQIGGQEDHVGRGTQALVAGHHDTSLLARAAQQFGSAGGWIEQDVRAHQAQPARQAGEHPVNRESGRFVHLAVIV